MNDLPVVDAAALERLREWGGDELVVKMIGLYIENTHARMAQIDEGLAGSDGLDEAERGAHSLKSSAANVGARQVNKLSQLMEDAADHGDEPKVRELRTELAAAVQRAETELKRILENEEG